MEIKNKKIYYEYVILDTYEAGIQLTGTEIKSIRLGKASLIDSYCYFHNNELYLKNSYISKYSLGTFDNHDEHRDRKLLLTKKELRNLNKDVQQPGYAIIPISMYIKHGLCKVKIGFCIGKKEYDKRETIKERDSKREIDRYIKNF